METNKQHSIGKTIQELRKKNNWTQAQLAEQINVSDKAISKWESDNGSPSIEFIPLLSEVFGVSTDYLLTGKMNEQDKEKLVSKPEPEKPMNEFVKLAVENRLQELAKNKRYQNSYGWNGLMCLGCKNEKKKVEAASWPAATYENYVYYILPDEFFAALASDKHVSKKTFDYVLNLNNWAYLGFPYLIHQCYLYNEKEKLEMLLDKTQEINKSTYDCFNNFAKNSLEKIEIEIYHYMRGFRYKNMSIVRILEETIRLALERQDYEMAERLNNINMFVKYGTTNGNISETATLKIFGPDCFIMSPDDVRMAKINADKNVSEIEKHIQSCIHDDILNIAELVPVDIERLDGGINREVKNPFVDKYFDEIVEAINKYPISYAELLDNFITDGEWDKLENYMPRLLRPNGNFFCGWARRSFKMITSELLDFKNDPEKAHEQLRKIYIPEYGVIVPEVEMKGVRNDWNRYKTVSLSSFVEYGKSLKEKFVTDLKFKYRMYNETENLTNEYFDSLIKEGRIRDVLIDLCVKLQSKLENKYRLEGDLMNEVVKYCQGHKCDDNVWFPLTKLVKCRNNAVHPKNSQETMTEGELRACIRIIDGM